MQAMRKKKDHREAIRAIRERGMTVTGWARTHGYKPDSVFQVLYGTFGKLGPVGEAILRDLRKEKLLKTTSDGTNAAKPRSQRVA